MEKEPSGAERTELFEFWVLEKLTQCYELLAVIAADADPKHTKQILEVHKAGRLVFPPGWRQADASE